MDYLELILDNITYIHLVVLMLSFLILKIFLRNDYTKKKPKTNKFTYKLFYADEKINNKNTISSKLLKSDKYGLKGKPDYILKHKILNKYIPIELKSGSIKENNKPRENDLMQLVTYFLIIEDIFGKKPKYGYLVYKDYMFIVKNTIKLRRKLLKTITDMKNMETVGYSKNTPDVNFPKCRLCKYRNSVCEFHKK